MSLSKENQFYEWLFGRGEFPYYKEPIEVPLPEYQDIFKCVVCTNKRYKSSYCYPHYLAVNHRNITVQEVKSRPTNIEVNHG